MSLWLYSYLIFKGALITLSAWLFTSVLSLTIGVLLGILSSRQLAFRRAQRVINFYAFIAKGIPAYVQILIAYFVLPAILGIQIPALVAAICALAFCSGGYVTQIVCAGINSINIGQWQACLVLGYPLTATLKRVIMPQVFKNILPSLFGELEQLLKSTALLATIGITELTRTGMNIISRELNPVAVYLLIALIYLLFSAILQVFAWYLQKSTKGGNCTW